MSWNSFLIVLTSRPIHMYVCVNVNIFLFSVFYYFIADFLLSFSVFENKCKFVLVAPEN
jgi:hypothetical protein